MKIIFMGSSEFGLPALEKLNQSYEIVAVYTRMPMPSGRGMKLTPTPIHKKALELNLPVYTPKNFKDNQDIEVFKSHGATMSIVASYGLLLPESVLNATPYGALNIHGSILPYHRGAAPIHRAIMQGDENIGVSIMQMSKGLDEGDVFEIWQTALLEEMTTGTAHDLLAREGGNLLMKVIEDIQTQKAKTTPQDHALSTYAHKILKSDCEIDWNKSAKEIIRFVRGLHPFPCAFFIKDGVRYKVHNVTYATEAEKDDEFVMACSDGYIRITIIQKEGDKVRVL